MSKALFVAIEAQRGHEEEIADFLRSSLGPVQEEPETRNWYAVRFNDSHFAVFDTFPGAAGQIRHLLGKAGRTLMLKSFTAMESVPDIDSADLIAAKPFIQGPAPALALYMPLQAREGRARMLANHLKACASMVADEPGTSAWYALDMGAGHFATFNVFPGKPARDAHLAGDVTGALVARAADLLAHPPELKGGEVLAAKLWA